MGRIRASERSLWYRGGPPSAPWLLDAAMGTRLIARGLDLAADDPCLWNLDRPGEVAAIHRLDVGAGADVLTTNTFGANRAWLSRYGRADEVAAINRAAVALAREAAGPDRFVFGCIGPTAGDSEAEQAEALGRAGVDALVLETNLSTEPVGRRLAALHERTGLPLILTFALVVEDDPMPPLDVDPRSVLLLAVGWNCIPPERAVEFPGRIRRPVGLPLVLKPSAGRPWADEVPRLLGRGVRFFGGCCGTTEADVAALRRALGPSRIGLERSADPW